MIEESETRIDRSEEAAIVATHALGRHLEALMALLGEADDQKNEKLAEWTQGQIVRAARGLTYIALRETRAVYAVAAKEEERVK